MAKSKRIAVIDRDKCQPQRCGYMCIKVCPGVRMKNETITVDDEKFPVISEDLCTGCGLCVKRCPYEAISIINLPHELEKPTHQYGVNAFRIYNFPTPKKGIIGLVGANGIGKSTIIKIMAGAMIPNLGEYDKEKKWDEIVNTFKEHEIKAYLEKLSKGKIKLSYKPQEVDKIPTVFKGKVSKLLEKSDERKIIPEITEKLELKCLDQNIDEISGGELQRVAIAAAVAKDADYYFFDEPSSFLDVKQRLAVAKTIRELSEKNVFVVEHDLAVLDYLTDYVHVLYGKPGAYGVVSTLKSSRVGINEFLSGFLKAENTRIRDYEIKFLVKPPASEWKSKKFYTYEAFEKKYEKFSLKTEPGKLYKGEVVGILGPNAIGKSTYMKVLAGVEKPSKGEPGFSVKISYKPQYIAITGDRTVSELVSKEPLDTELFDAEIKPLVRDLYEKNISKLSGGELQRLAISLALGKQSEVVLLDEPSAFLDIEQRFRLSAVIKRLTEKKEVTTLVIDHDVLFQDLVANRIMIFNGIPGKRGEAASPVSMHEGMNSFLKEMDITMRREPESGRPRINKKDSQMDSEQKRTGEYYYSMA